MIYHDRACSIPENDSFARHVTTGSLINIGIGTVVLKVRRSRWFDDVVAGGVTAAPHRIV